MIFHFISGIGARNDIALLRLNESVPLNSDSPTMSSVSPICLPWSKNNPGRNVPNGTKVLLTGWGHTTNNHLKQKENLERIKSGSSFLRKVKIPIISVDVCSKTTTSYKDLNATTQICAGGDKGQLFFNTLSWLLLCSQLQNFMCGK